MSSKPAERVAVWVALGTVGVFLIWSAIRVREITVPLYQNSDIASAPLVAEFFPDRGSGHVTLGNYPWLESLFGLHWTRWLPSHEATWKALPFLAYGATVAVVGWTVLRSVSRRAGLVVALAMAAPAPFVIYMLGAPDQRLPALAHTVVLAAFLVALPAAVGWSTPGRLLWAAGLAITLAPGVASDPLLIPAAVIPFLGAIAVGWWLGLLRREAALLAASACIAGVVGGWLLLHLAEHELIVYNHGAFDLATAGRVVSNAGLLLENVALFVHGNFAAPGTDIGGFDALRELVAVAAIVGVVAFGVAITRAAPRLLAEDARSLEQRLLAVYWGLSIAAVSVAFVITNAPVGTNAVRYVTTLWPALLTLAVVAYGRRAVVPLAVLASACAILGCVELARGLYTPGTGPPPDARETELLQRFVADNHLDHGYAGYWDAAPLDVQSDFHVRAYPIELCGPHPETYCPFHSHQIEAWYEPKAGVRSFYVVNGRPLEPATRPPPAAWGRPVKTAHLGDLTVYAYDYDIASHLQRIEPGAFPQPSPSDR